MYDDVVHFSLVPVRLDFKKETSRVRSVRCSTIAPTFRCEMLRGFPRALGRYVPCCRLYFLLRSLPGSLALPLLARSHSCLLSWQRELTLYFELLFHSDRSTCHGLTVAHLTPVPAPHNCPLAVCCSTCPFFYFSVETVTSDVV